MKDYNVIPGFSNYLINREGKIYNKKRNTFLRGSTNPKGYVNFRLSPDNRKAIFTLGLHRVLMLTYNPIPNPKKYDVNHIDGDKGNNSLDNLEWCTRKYNTEHAGANGLSPKCKPVLVRNVHTNVIDVYPSAKQCSIELSLSKDAILYRLNKSHNIVWDDGKQYQWKLIAVPWFKNTRSPDTYRKGVLVRSIKTGTIIEFDMLQDAATFLGIKPSTITRWFKKTSQPITPCYHQLKRSDDDNQWEHVVDVNKECANSARGRTIEVTNVHTDEIKIYSSCKACANEFGISPTVLNYRLSTPYENQFNKFLFNYVNNIK